MAGSAGALQQVAINGNRVVALGQATIGKGPAIGSATGTEPGAVPFAELSADGGATWQQVPFSSPGPYTSFTALTANGAGFTAAGLFGQPGQQDVALWASATGGSWKPYQSGGLNGSAAWQIDTMTRSGAQVAEHRHHHHSAEPANRHLHPPSPLEIPMRVTDLDLDLTGPGDRGDPRGRGDTRPRHAARPTRPGSRRRLGLRPRQSIRSRISRTRSIEVCGCRNANLATVSPSHADGGMKAT